MKPRTMLALPLVAALAGLWQSPTQAAPAAATTTTTTTDLRGVTQNWDKVLPAEPGAGCPNWNTRFTCVMNNAAVRDNETGLVWTHPSQQRLVWREAKLYCANLSVGNRKGWRLPSVAEMSSLIDMSNPSAIKLPANRPFILQTTPGMYWTSTVDKMLPPLVTDTYHFYTDAYYVTISGHVYVQDVNFAQLNVWCVRGGSGETGEH